MLTIGPRHREGKDFNGVSSKESNELFILNDVETIVFGAVDALVVAFEESKG